MKYIAYLHQDGGCDYTIGCGSAIRHLHASNMDEALKEALKHIDTYDIDTISSAVIFEVNDSKLVDVQAFYKQIRQETQEEERKLKEVLEKREYLRLKKKYEQDS